MMPGNFNIDRIKHQIQARGGFTRGIFFDCNITSLTIPDVNGLFTFNQDDTIVCRAVNLPTETIDVTEAKYFTRSVKIPMSRQYQPITLTFYNTVNGELRSKFVSWMNLFNSPRENMRGVFEAGGVEQTSQPAATVRGRYEDWFSTIQLTSYNNTGKLTMKDLLNVGINTAISAGESLASRSNSLVGSAAGVLGSKFKREIESNNPKLARYTFYNAFPTSITGLQFSQEDDTTYQTYDVEFQYLYSDFTNLIDPRGVVTTHENTP